MQQKSLIHKLTFLAFVRDRYKQLAHRPRSLRSPNLEATMRRTLHNLSEFTKETANGS
jgi:hypothetical protein